MNKHAVFQHLQKYKIPFCNEDGQTLKLDVQAGCDIYILGYC